MRQSMLEVVRQDYVQTARAKGLSERVRAGRPLPFPDLTAATAAAQRVPAFASSPWLHSLNSLAAPWPLSVARMPEPRSEGNGGCPFIFRRGPPEKGWGSALHREAK